MSLADWRNYRSLDLDLGAGPTVLAGRNGQGKTNLVEAIGYLSTLSSHRVSGDAALIRADADAAVIRATVVAGEREELAEVQVNRVGANRAQLNRGAVRPRAIMRAVSSVLFAPEDLAIIRGEPSARRRYLDELMVARTPRLAGALADYDRALKQRNGLLRQARGARLSGAPATLDVWDERLIAPGVEILDARDALIADIAPLVQAQYALVAGDDHVVALRAVRSIDSDDPSDGPSVGDTRSGFASALERARQRELDRGITLVGPHRDDLAIALNDLPARGYASHGESWSLALALRLGAVELLRESLPGGDPVVILDDVFAELDERRRGRLADRMSRYEQVLITAAVESDVPQELAGSVTRISAGAVVTA